MPEMTVDWKHVQSEWRRNDFSDFWLLVKPSGAMALDPSVVEAAGGEATDLLDADGRDEGTVGGSTVALSAGVAVYVARTSTREDLQHWLETFAASLAASGYSGTVRGAPSSYPPSWVDEKVGRYQMTAFVAYTTDRETERTDGRLIWAVPSDQTSQLVTQALTWTMKQGGRGYLGLGTFYSRLAESTDDPRVAEVLSSALPRYLQGAIWAVDQRSLRVRTSKFSSPGLSQYSYAEESIGWRDRLQDLLTVVRGCPELIDVAMVRPGPVSNIGWQSMEVNGPAVNVTSAWYYARRKELQYTVPDAHGVQLLSGAHLNRSHDLSNWIVEEVCPDRFLVSAPDLAPWFESGVADPEVVSAARSDFGGMIGFAP